MKDNIVQALQQFGPLLPVEIASKTGLDSFMAKAYAEELIAEHRIIPSKEKIANSHIYYLPGQEAQLNQRIAQINAGSQKTARIYSSPSPAPTPEVQNQRDAFAQRLKDIEDKERRRKEEQTHHMKQLHKAYSLPPVRPLPITRPVSPPAQQTVPEYKPTPIVAPSTPEQYPFELEKEESKNEESFVDRAMDWLRLENVELLDEIGSGRNEVELLARANSEFGPLKFYIKIKQKKTITQADLLAVYASALENRCPGVLITNGELAKSADNFLEEKKGQIKVKQI
jgi:hypothetical protein